MQNPESGFLFGVGDFYRVFRFMLHPRNAEGGFIRWFGWSGWLIVGCGTRVRTMVSKQSEWNLQDSTEPAIFMSLYCVMHDED
jgi:hypothetical protein